MIRRFRHTVYAAVVGAALAYLWDPEQGVQRREALQVRIRTLLTDGRARLDHLETWLMGSAHKSTTTESGAKHGRTPHSAPKRDHEPVHITPSEDAKESASTLH